MFVRNVVIVGGGSAGWLTALNFAVKKPNYNLYLVQGKNHAPIGVGESTQPNLCQLITHPNNNFFSFNEFVLNTDATVKCGIYYTDWKDIGTEYWHPFTTPINNGTWEKTEYEPEHFYQQQILNDPSNFSHEKYYKDVHPSYTVCVQRNLIDPLSGKALHIDALKMVNFLQERLKDHVTIIEPDQIEFLVEDEENVIDHILCDGQKVKGDLYIDCTGFGRSVMKNVSDCDIIDYDGNVESAFFAQLEYEDERKECHPYTHAHAFKHGWMWTIPLQSRIGVGCVFSRNSISKKECLEMFVEHWNGRVKEDSVKFVEFNCNALKKFWVSNVVTVGLSSGFIEPLEATSIAWGIESVNSIIRTLECDYFGEEEVDLYNANLRKYVNDIFDFVDVHYKLSNRRDSLFWQYHTEKRLDPRLEFKLKKFSEEMPNIHNRNTETMWAFNHISWIDILNGYEFQYEKDKKFAENNKETGLLKEILIRELQRRNSFAQDTTFTPLHNKEFFNDPYQK